ncbi:MAG: mechanosensitive ion channel family protein [Cyanobacteria bacterium REEB459]|nr:mechanosensitive ion channel family protein [Cyanobacteria bacterium REEB459]
MVSLVVCLLGFAIEAQAQLPNPLENSVSTPPMRVQRAGVLEVTAVTLDGKDLFDIAAPVVLNRQQPGLQIPVELRARQIELTLNQVVSQALTYLEENAVDAEPQVPGSELIQVRIEQINNLPALFARIGKFSEPRVLLTVTNHDSQYHGRSPSQLAQVWQRQLQESLLQSLASRQPAALKTQLRTALLILLGSLGLTVLLAGSWQLLGWRKRSLEHKPDVAPRSFAAEILSSPELSPVSRYQLSTRQRLQLVAFFRWLIFWGIAFVWIAGLAGTLHVFPQTRRYASDLFKVPVLCLLTWFTSGLLNRLANIGIDGFAQAWEKNDLGSGRNVAHRAMRISTIINAAKGFKTVVIYLLAASLLLQALKLAPVSVFALGAIAALALSFAAQSLVKDLVNGVLILLEDQYAIGDLVSTGTATGIVENLNLRITQIRGEDGRLVTLPNSLVTQVANLSRNWSRAVITIDVAYHTDVDRALAVVQTTAQTMAQDPNWRGDIITPIENLGVNEVTHAGLTLLLWIRTQPLKQYGVAREFRRRLRLALAAAGIPIGIPQQELTPLPEEKPPENHPGPDHPKPDLLT